METPQDNFFLSLFLGRRTLHFGHPLGRGKTHYYRMEGTPSCFALREGRKPYAACGIPLPHGVLLQAAAVALNPSSHPVESLGMHFAVQGYREIGRDVTILESEYSAWKSKLGCVGKNRFGMWQKEGVK
ncbi:hypothetical protein TNCT_339971 [Trichonephila clavata]|uniref:Uncharacterized protein n=1 Tax=Trichonephila clavata TaxID=2740835 RepID=A0A8X6I9B8_TRICU|nr:hypothetical protein TNCT_339971 [Trichonephila clavata]